MPERPARERRHWDDVVVIATGLLLIGLAAWNAAASSGRSDIVSLQWLYVAYGFGGGLVLVALFIAHRSRTAGRVLLVAAVLVLLGFGLNAFGEASGTLCLIVVLPAVLLLGATPFMGAMPREPQGSA
jgi:hypothetical protein